MKTVIYHKNRGAASLEIEQTLRRVALGSDISDLVVAVYLLPHCGWTGGSALVRSWQTSRTFVPRRGRWRLVKSFAPPSELPSRFKLIRLLLTDDVSRYPRQEEDVYGWRHSYAAFIDHLAFLFAHELHHFRRYHCGLHPREGENRANAWAAAHVAQLGYRVQSRPPVRRKSGTVKTKSRGFFYDIVKARFQRIKSVEETHFEKARQLNPGDTVRIRIDPRKIYSSQTARVLRPLRRHAYRIALITNDGKQWRWPVMWLEL
ncbi:hypothetical protein JW992_00315 [candidate division KSB1 bacterium]|nr:hypothetical protein [candidate division KSB1 bacterium]